MHIRAFATLLSLAGVVLGATSSSTSGTSSTRSSGGAGGLRSTQLSTASIASATTTSTVIPTATSSAARVSATAAPVALNDSMPVRTQLNVTGARGAFFTFNTTADVPIYISMSLCSGPEIPAYNTSNSTLLDELGLNALQARRATLVGMFVSEKSSIVRPGPWSNLPSKQIAYAQGGWASIVLEKGSKNGIWIGIWPPIDAREAFGMFSVQIAASTKAQMEQVATRQGVLLDDTDSSRALLTSFNYTNHAPNISLMVLPTEGPFSLSSITYYNSSFCAIFDLWNTFNASMHALHINSSDTTRHTASVLTRESELLKYLRPEDAPSISAPTATGSAGLKDPLEERGIDMYKRANSSAPHGGGRNKTHDHQQRRMQFEVSGLQRGTNYTAYLVSSVMQNGIITRRLYPSVKFVTKKSTVCRLLYNVPFCPELAYAIPFNEEMSMTHALSEINGMISANFANFSATLSTFPCDSQEFGMYSSVATCTDCVRAYQNWLCAVAIPRCTDVVDPLESAASQDGKDLEGLPMDTNVHLYPYIVNRIGQNSSRQPYIDRLFNPGPYGELLPCLTVCEMVTRSCPPLIKWSCPIWTVTAQRDYGTFADANSLGLGYGANGGAGDDGMRFGGWPSVYVATDAFGHSYCNAMDTDRILRIEVGAARTLVPRVWLTAAAAAALSLLYIY
ncbi:stretch-activated cation channel mid1 [Malassezia cuniculi]|uniref:Stretch-activated cation channel mid1 n=1 Tax=Malassezia cuniculi TaxID=948313 RepID=A0AAF0EVV4_9BASI|nr:stretch-activated cation channel mid1 [Malassezia cuniculi]